MNLFDVVLKLSCGLIVIRLTDGVRLLMLALHVVNCIYMCMYLIFNFYVWECKCSHACVYVDFINVLMNYLTCINFNYL